ncbi:hypothetical protein BWI15_19750 [Kribbella sp. ALI-6-A]|uniref:VOC family protein n=1 Tax=Kribbella sp. ALI-6-A TaxID=1933817 RepID=UPI00097C477F|nr:VOC family protein [Kribbella sp. ALI-6-A]ONI72287.1 hypothetical protein BWI15_19750 [Kribbella sp. ALI-6-A]
MDAIGELSDLVFDCADPDRLAEFWSQVFGMRVLRTDADSATLAGTRRPLTDTLDEDQAAWRIMADPEGHPFCLVTTR